jgi:hypothetical protein
MFKNPEINTLAYFHHSYSNKKLKCLLASLIFVNKPGTCTNAAACRAPV